MHHLRLLIIAIATICVLALGVFALVSQPQVPGDDVIIIKGGSLEITCGKNHGNDCLGAPDSNGKYKHKKDTAHITNIVVKDSKTNTSFLNRSFGPKDNQPQVEITYK